MDAKTAVIAVDVQNDFCPGGKLAVTDGDQVVEPLNRLLRKAKVKVATRDFHPAGTNHGGVAWPEHCVQGTDGAAFHPDLDLDGAVVVSKGTKMDEDGYSGFVGTVDETGQTLDELLKFNGITRLIIGGLATDYCVLRTALDALRLGYEVIVPLDTVRAVDLNLGDGPNALREMEAAGAKLQLSIK